MFSPKQLQVLKFPYEKKYDAIICDGSIRSGKSSVQTFSFITWSMNNFNQCNFALCGKTIRSAERNIVKEIMKIKYLQENYEMHYSQTNSLLTIKRGTKVNYYYVFGGKDESSYQLIQGMTLAGVLLDEVALFSTSLIVTFTFALTEIFLIKFSSSTEIKSL